MTSAHGALESIYDLTFGFRNYVGVSAIRTWFSQCPERHKEFLTVTGAKGICDPVVEWYRLTGLIQEAHNHGLIGFVYDVQLREGPRAQDHMLQLTGALRNTG